MINRRMILSNVKVLNKKEIGNITYYNNLLSKRKGYYNVYNIFKRYTAAFYYMRKIDDFNNSSIFKIEEPDGIKYISIFTRRPIINMEFNKHIRLFKGE